MEPMWHYNGKSWSIVPITKIDGGTIDNTNHGFSDIYGFSKYDIWAVGRKSAHNRAFVIHYNGMEWKEVTPPDTSQLMAIGGIDKNNLWVGAYGGGIFRYDGNSWKDDILNFPEPPGNGAYVHDFFNRPNYPSYSFYIDKENSPVYKHEKLILRNTGNNWDLVYKQNDYNISGLWVSEKGTLYTGGFKIVKFGAGGPEIVGETPSNFSAGQLYGTSESHLFACGRYFPDDQGTIFYYNGKEWFDLLDEKIDGVAFVDIWTDGKMVIALGFTTNPFGNTIILRGE